MFSATQTAAGRGLRRASAALAFAAAWAAPAPAEAQDEVRNFRKPILAVETGGHHAPVRSLVWAGPFRLISGGEDKAVKVWDFRDGPRMVNTIRPPVWRGPAGVIHAMALSPTADARGQSLLAVAGVGVESRRGDFSVYRVPGSAEYPTGEVVARVLPPADAQAVGHRNSILCLAFDPSGRILASGGNDGQVILWDASAAVKVGGLSTFRPLRALAGHTGPVRVLGFVGPNGDRLVTAGQDGTIALWDVARGVLLDRNPGNPQRPTIVNALAVSPDRRSFVVGTEGGLTRGGLLVRFDAGRVSDGREVVLPTRLDQGAVEALAFHPDGRRLVASLKSDRLATLDPLSVACDLEIRSYPDGAVTRSARVPGLVRACAYAADGRRLAYSGGFAQAVYVEDARDPGRPAVELKGEGTTVYDLGFRADGRVVGFSRGHDPASPPALYEGFDLGNRRSAPVPRAELRRAVTTLNGWTLQGDVNAYRLDAVNADGRRWRADLHPIKEGLCWSHTFIPPGPGHPRATVAVGCGAGVVVYDLETGRRTRMVAGHLAPVVSVVPSPDGHWLATGSLDQTVQFWPLAGCDTRPGFGATLRRGGGGVVVAAVAPGGFAAASGLTPGDVVVTAAVQTPADPAPVLFSTADAILGAFTARADALAPNDQIALRVRKTLDLPVIGTWTRVEALGTTKRDAPALTLMLDVSREWVLWTPRGYYDTSIDGDSRLLGWHLNPSYDGSRPTDYFPIGTFSRTMYRPEVIERLWAARAPDLAQAAGKPAEQEAADEPPPLVTFAAAGAGLAQAAGGLWEATVPRPRVRVKITAPGASTLAERAVILGEQVVKPRQAVGGGSEYEEVLDLDLPRNRRVRLLVTATNIAMRSRPAFIDLEWKAPPEPQPPPPAVGPRVFVLSLDAGAFTAAPLPPIRFADRDARALAGFASASLVSADGARPAAPSAEDRVSLSGPGASAAKTAAALDRLAGLLRDRQLKPGDVVAVAVSCHALGFKGAPLPRLALADTDLARPSETTVDAAELSDLLGRFTDYGCRVVLFLDGVHEGELPPSVGSGVKAWVRDLYLDRRVITLVASKEGPGGVSVRDRHGLFALGVQNAMRGSVASSSSGRVGPPVTLKQFRDALAREVLSLSDRRQEAEVYLPPGVPPWAPFAAP